jgi:hypothetical protein
MSAQLSNPEDALLKSSAQAVAESMEALAAMQKTAGELRSQVTRLEADKAALQAEVQTVKQASQGALLSEADAGLVADLLIKHRELAPEEKSAAVRVFTNGGAPKLMLAFNKLASLLPSPVALPSGEGIKISQFGSQAKSPDSPVPWYVGQH